jgi:pheromone shutdown protein TraB
LIISISGQRDIKIVGIVKALKSYGDLVEKLIKDYNFIEILLSTTNEDINGIREFIKAPFEISLDDLEIMYEQLMKNFGETSVPPEAYVRAVKLADERGLKIRGIDIPEGDYEDLYVKFIDIKDLILLSLRKNRLMKKKWSIDNPEKTSLEWDREVSKGGYRRLENEREKFMANQIALSQSERILVIIEIERLSGVINYLKNQMPEYKFQVI